MFWCRQLCLIVASLFVLDLQAVACIHPPHTYKGRVTEKTKEALIYHDGLNAHLLIKTNLKADSLLPRTMAWVIPLPSVPVKYEVVKNDLFRELFDLTAPPFDGPPAKGMPPESDGIKVHEKQVVGDYEIQPLEILSEDAGSELNTWLTQHGFGAVLVENQKFYLRKGHVFLTLKIKKLSGLLAEIQPLHIVYKSDRAIIPIKFSSHSGVFDLVLYTLTKKKPDPKLLERFHLSIEAVVPLDGDKMRKKYPNLFNLIGSTKGYLTHFSGQHYNAPGNLVKDLPEDPFVGDL